MKNVYVTKKQKFSETIRLLDIIVDHPSSSADSVWKLAILYVPVIISQIYQLGFNENRKDDALQDGLVAAFQVIKTYAKNLRPAFVGKYNSFPAYFSICIRRRLIRLSQNNQRNTSDCLSDQFSEQQSASDVFKEVAALRSVESYFDLPQKYRDEIEYLLFRKVNFKKNNKQVIKGVKKRCRKLVMKRLKKISEHGIDCDSLSDHPELIMNLMAKQTNCRPFLASLIDFILEDPYLTMVLGPVLLTP